MPTKPVQRFTSWSFSRYHDWVTCALRAKLKHLDKIKEPEGPALAKGQAMHKLAEDYAMGRLAKLPAELANFKAEFTDLRKQGVTAEQQWALDNQWQPTGWFDKNAWSRSVIDAVYSNNDDTVVTIIDHKTGKVYPYHQDQLSLYAINGFMQFPSAKEVETKLWYLDQGEENKHVFKLKELPSLKKLWAGKVKPMLADVKFEPNPGNHCRYCPHSRSKGGVCQY